MRKIAKGALMVAALVLCVGSAHATEFLVSGKKLLIKNPPSGTVKNKIVFLSKDTTTMIGAPASGDDPRCSAPGGGGGRLSVRGTSVFTIDLPCAGWSANGGLTLYKYKDTTGATCSIVQVKNGVLSKAVCKGAQVAFVLGTAQGNVDVEVTTGGGSAHYCATFGGTVKHDGSDGKTYLSLDAPTASSCPCCLPARTTLVSSAGTLTVDNLAPFPFPSGIVTTMDTGAAIGAPGECRHDAVLPSGGFRVPHFDIPALNYCSEVIDLHCESGTGEGAGAVWDGLGTAGLAMTNVNKNGDTSDGVCGTLGTGCTTGAGGAGADTLGDIDETVSLAPGGGLRSLLDIRARSRTWSDSVCSPAISPGCCVTSSYGDDTVGNGELLITLFDFILSPTTNTATSAFVDKNADGCKRAGSGFNNPGPDGPKSLTGSPAAGPCCVVGQATTVVAVGIGFSGGAPLFDLGFQNVAPNTVGSCGTPGVATCTVTTNNCLK